MLKGSAKVGCEVRTPPFPLEPGPGSSCQQQGGWIEKSDWRERIGWSDSTLLPSYTRQTLTPRATSRRSLK